MLVALPAGGRGGDKLDAGAAAPEAPAAAVAEAGAAQAVPTTGRGVTAAPAEAQASTGNTAATPVATGDGGGDHRDINWRNALSTQPALLALQPRQLQPDAERAERPQLLAERQRRLPFPPWRPPDHLSPRPRHGDLRTELRAANVYSSIIC